METPAPEFSDPPISPLPTRAGSAAPAGNPLLSYFASLKTTEIRNLEERMEATLREMGVTFDFVRGKAASNPWFCDVLPHLFGDDEWRRITEGTRQRLKAFELFLHDVYGPKDILYAGVIPLPLVLGSPHYQRVCQSLRPAENAYLHLTGLALTRDARGQITVKNHYFSHASGVAYMMQNRRVLARVVPEIFRDFPVASIADTPLAIVEKLRAMSPETSDPLVVLLSPGTSSAVYSEHSFLARRMGIPLVQGGDLLVLDDCVYLKTIAGLEKVETIYTRVADAWLDPLVFRRDSLLGVPGLVHCVRKGTVSLVNAIGAQLADDRTLLGFSSRIIRFYLGEDAILPNLATFWMGDIDQREMVLSEPEKYHFRPLTGERVLSQGPNAGSPEEQLAALKTEVRKHPNLFVAQEVDGHEKANCFINGKRTERVQDHLIFALRRGSDYQIFPGALTRVAPQGSRLTASGLGGGSKDSWVSARAENELCLSAPVKPVELHLPSRQVTSRVADRFYWMGRYLERAHCMAYMIQVVETLEIEELNSAERKLYRPLWNRLLPPLEGASGAGGRRSITSALERYRLLLEPGVAGTVIGTFKHALHNSESLQESLSPEAWGCLVQLNAQFERSRFRLEQSDTEYTRTTRRTVNQVVHLIPQFFAVAQGSMLQDDGWKFCEIGQMLERAVVTANAVVSISKSFVQQAEIGVQHSSEIELSAFLRLLGTRDAYRRIYQMRTAPVQVLEILWQHRETPRSVLRCLNKCAALLRESIAVDQTHTSRALAEIEDLVAKIARINWNLFFTNEPDDEMPSPPGGMDAETLAAQELATLLQGLLRETLNIHTAISDGFLNHQAVIAQREQLLLTGFNK